MVPTCCVRDGVSKPVMVSVKARDRKNEPFSSYYFGYAMMALLQTLFITSLLYSSVFIADMIFKKERVLLLCVTAKAPSLSMVFGRCCLLTFSLARKLVACLVVLLLLLLLSGDVETNPGPTTGERRGCICTSPFGVLLSARCSSQASGELAIESVPTLLCAYGGRIERVPRSYGQ